MGQKAGSLAEKVDTWPAHDSSLHLLSAFSFFIGSKEVKKAATLCLDDCRSNASNASCKRRKGSSQRRERILRRLGINQSKENEPHISSPPLHLQPKREIAETFAAKDESLESRCSNSSEVADATQRTGANLNEDSHLRRKFLEKLSYQSVYITRALRPPSYQTVIIFDWDDTLLCTSYLNYKNCLAGVDHLPEAKQNTLKAIEQASAQLLNLAIEMGQTFIITNALDCWIEHTAKVWAPSITPLLQKVKVLSARSRYESQYPGDASKWKEEAFKDIGRNFDAEVVANIVSLGDSQYEMDAAQTLGKEFQQSSVKLVKFRPQPAPEELVTQLKFLTGRFQRVVSKAGNHTMDLQWCA